MAFCLIGALEPLHAYKTANATNFMLAPKTIQEAIDAATPGDTIYISAGVYHENIVINKPITIVSEGSANTIISGNYSGTTVEILSDNVSLCGFKLCNAEKSAITLTNVKNCKIRENLIDNIPIFYGRGIYAFNCENITVEENDFTNISDEYVSLYLTKKSQIKGNNFTANMRYSQPIFLSYSNNNVIESNLVSGQGVENEGGIGLIYSNNNVIRYNRVVENDWAGISLRSSNCCVIEGNLIMGQTWDGLIMENCKNNNVYWNNFVSNYRDAHLGSCENMTWDAENLGNYWDDYIGKDENNNGVGDDPYQVDLENYDIYPLMGRFYRYEVTGIVGEEAEIFLVSNSTVDALCLVKTSESVFINVNVSGNQGTFGFCLIKFPKDTVEQPYSVEVNGFAPIVLMDYSNDAFAILYFSYLHQNQQEVIIIVPEFGWSLLFTIFCVLSLVILLRRNRFWHS
jgi:nitrous oxidase accessory protein